jgi:hypothetical protein
VHDTGIWIHNDSKSSEPCRCWVEPKETITGQDQRDSIHSDSLVHGFAGASNPRHDEVREQQRRGFFAEHEQASSLIPKRPVRVLYGVWRN